MYIHAHTFSADLWLSVLVLKAGAAATPPPPEIIGAAASRICHGTPAGFDRSQPNWWRRRGWGVYCHLSHQICVIAAVLSWLSCIAPVQCLVITSRQEVRLCSCRGLLVCLCLKNLWVIFREMFGAWGMLQDKKQLIRFCGWSRSRKFFLCLYEILC